MHHFILSFQDVFLLDRSETTAGNQRCKRGGMPTCNNGRTSFTANMHVSSAYNSPPQKKTCIKQTMLFENTLFLLSQTKNSQKQNQQKQTSEALPDAHFPQKVMNIFGGAFFSLDLPGHETRREETETSIR